MSEHTDPLRGAKILVVDDVPANLDLLVRTLEAKGCTMLAAPNGERAIATATRALPDLILLDVMMPGMTGLECCQQLKASEITRGIPILFITAQHEMNTLVEAFAAGGVDYITKPFKAEEVLARVGTHLKIHGLTCELQRKNEELQAEIDGRQRAERALKTADEQLSVLSGREAERWGLKAFVGRSPAFAKLVEGVRQAQPHGGTSVLITGESGTGKELIARAIHFGGPRAKGPFIAINCTAIPAELAESTLFGHVKGAFTGATADRKGCFEQANGGTFFLDEIGDMPAALQAKLLRVLETGVFTPVGAAKERSVDVRVVAATNADLQSDIATGRFRSDVYYRLARFTIEVPPLRERREDVGLLAAHFAESLATEMGMAQPSLSAEAVGALESYDFPGNIRELRNLIERALMVSGGGVIAREHLRFDGRWPGGAVAPISTAATFATLPVASGDEDRILAYVREHGSINNTECRDVLGAGMQRACYLLRKLHLSGALKRDSSGRWAQYRLS